jgi:hypothetical protein
MKGILVSLFLKKKSIDMHMIVNSKVKKLKSVNVSTRIVRGFVSAFELAEMKKALMFSIVRGKNFVMKQLL